MQATLSAPFQIDSAAEMCSIKWCSSSSTAEMGAHMITGLSKCLGSVSLSDLSCVPHFQRPRSISSSQWLGRKSAAERVTCMRIGLSHCYPFSSATSDGLLYSSLMRTADRGDRIDQLSWAPDKVLPRADYGPWALHLTPTGINSMIS